MVDDTSRLNEFEPASYEAWRKLVEKDLKGADFDKRLVKEVAGGIQVQPLYTRADAKPDAQGLPGQPPFVRGTDGVGRAEMGWDVRQPQQHMHVREASAALEEDLAGGVSSAWIRLDRSLRAGSGEPCGDGILATHVGALDVLFEGVDLSKVPVALEAGAQALPAAAALLALAARRNVPQTALSGWLYADPVGALAEHGTLPTSLSASLAEMVDLAAHCASEAPNLRAAVVRTAPYHDAGADAVQELGIAIATGIVYLRAMVDGGLPVDDAASQIGFDFSVGRDFFVEVAKLRAVRKLWARVVQVAGGSEAAQAMCMHARTSTRTKTQRDPWVNMLRGTAESFAAAVGGADSIATSSFDCALGASDSFSRRMARNTQIILRDESNVHRVVDPAGGSWYVEHLTDALANAAWKQMQQLEAAGGVDAAVRAGEVQRQVAETAAKDAEAAAKRKVAITGVNEFPHLREEPVERPSPDTKAAAAADAETAIAKGAGLKSALSSLPAASSRTKAATEAAKAGASLPQIRAALGAADPVQAPALTPASYAAGFETLRARSDAALTRSGARPKVLLVNLGPIPKHKARASFAANFFEAGGIEALTGDGFASAEEAAQAFVDSGAQLACVCSSDDVYAEQAEAVGKALAEKGAKAVVLAGKPANEAALRKAGFTDFIFMGKNVQATLESLLDRLGVTA